MAESDTLNLTIHHHGTPHPLTLPSSATLQDLSSALASNLSIPPEKQKLLISPKPGMQKPPFPTTPLSTLLPSDYTTSPRFKITLLGTPTAEIETLNSGLEEQKRKEEARATAHAIYRAKPTPSSTSSSAGKIQTLSSSANNYTFHRLLPLTYLPNPTRSLDFLTRLRDDVGIRATMRTHGFSVPVLTEMNPAEHTTHEGRTLGLNRNRGEVIELRLRTDAYDGYRDYRTIRRTLCHELAHCVYGEHDAKFWELTRRIEGEVERKDWRARGRALTEMDFYNPGDWEKTQEGGEVVDERGWTGGEYVLGGVGDGQTSAAGGGHVEGRRELLAKAAEERMRKKHETGENQ